MTRIKPPLKWMWPVEQLNPRLLSPGRPRDADVDQESKARARKLAKVRHRRSQAPSMPRAGCSAPRESRPLMPQPTAFSG